MTVLGKAIVNVAGRPAHNVDGPSVRARWTIARKVFFSLTGHRVYLKQELFYGPTRAQLGPTVLLALTYHGWTVSLVRVKVLC